MDTTQPLLPSSMPLAPLPPRGANAPLPNPDEFKQLLASQGLQIPAQTQGGTMSESEARIAAAQIAAKAEVNARVKRDRVVAGMAPGPAPMPAPTPGRFMSLRTGPGAARAFVAPSNDTSANTVEGLRATTKFAPGPMRDPNLTRNAPAVAQALKRAPVENTVPAPAIAVPKAIEAYNYGLRAASEKTPAEVPLWFEGAMQDALKKYEAMKSMPPQ